MTDAPDWEGFGRDLMQDWPVRDVDGCELFEAALRNGLLRQVTGGYDPGQHIDAECICPETGDPWYEYAFPHTRADLATPTPAMCCLGLTPEQCAHTPSSQCEGLVKQEGE